MTHEEDKVTWGRLGKKFENEAEFRGYTAAKLEAIPLIQKKVDKLSAEVNKFKGVAAFLGAFFGAITTVIFQLLRFHK